MYYNHQTVPIQESKQSNWCYTCKREYKTNDKTHAKLVNKKLSDYITPQFTMKDFESMYLTETALTVNAENATHKYKL